MPELTMKDVSKNNSELVHSLATNNLSNNNNVFDQQHPLLSQQQHQQQHQHHHQQHQQCHHKQTRLDKRGKVKNSEPYSCSRILMEGSEDKKHSNRDENIFATDNTNINISSNNNNYNGNDVNSNLQISLDFNDNNNNNSSSSNNNNNSSSSNNNNSNNNNRNDISSNKNIDFCSTDYSKNKRNDANDSAFKRNKKRAYNDDDDDDDDDDDVDDEEKEDYSGGDDDDDDDDDVKLKVKIERCAGCGEKITDRYLLSVVNKQWHLTCLVCSACKLPLNPEVTCYAKDDEIYCKDDYYRRFAPKTCSCCQSNISSDQLVMRVRDRIYHLHCFVCSVCSKQLTTGEPFGYNSDDNSLFCKLHYEIYHAACSTYDDDNQDGIVNSVNNVDPRFSPTPADRHAPSSPILSATNLLHMQHHPHTNDLLSLDYNNQHRHFQALAFDRSMSSMFGGPLCCESANPSTGVCFLHTPIPHHQHLLGSMVHHQTANLQKGRPRKRKSVMTDVEHFVPNLGSEMNQDEAMLQHQRQKRMRTSFKHHQLRIMKSYFSLNHNPDSKDLKQLAQKTGLSKRVLQVWFQNARAKHRRTAIKDRDKQSSTTAAHQQQSQQNESKSDKSLLNDSIDGVSLLTPTSHHHQQSRSPSLTQSAADIRQQGTNMNMAFASGDLNKCQNIFGHDHFAQAEQSRQFESGSPGVMSDVSSSSFMGFRSSFQQENDCQVSNFADIFSSSLKQMGSC